MTKVSHILIMGKGAKYIIFVWIVHWLLRQVCGQFFSNGESLSCLGLHCETPTLLEPGVFNTDVLPLPHRAGCSQEPPPCLPD